MIKTIITIALGLLVLNIMAICKAAGDYDRQVEEEDGEGSNNKTGRGKA